MKSLFILACVAGALYFGPAVILTAALFSVVLMGFVGVLLVIATLFV